jgi:putative redox protein
MANEIKVVLQQLSASASEATMGKHKVAVDRPIEKGGSDLGPMGGQLFLSAVGGCFMSNILAAIKSRGADISNVTAEVTGSIVDSPPRFVAIDVEVSAATGDNEGLEHIVTIADRGCIMMNTLRDKLNVTIRVDKSRTLVGR